MLIKLDSYTHAPSWWASRWPNFSPFELRCRGTGQLIVDTSSLDRLQTLRNSSGIPFLINSAGRSEQHNIAVGGSPVSQHLYGKAFDIALTHALEINKGWVVASAKKLGFNGFGLSYRSFIHMDTRDVPAVW